MLLRYISEKCICIWTLNFYLRKYTNGKFWSDTSHKIFSFPKKGKPFWILKLFRESITIVLSKKSILRGSDILLVFSESPSYLRITLGTSLKFDITTSTSIVSFRSEKLEQKKNHNGLNSRVFSFFHVFDCVASTIPFSMQSLMGKLF